MKRRLPKILLLTLALLVLLGIGGAWWFERQFFTAAPNQLTVSDFGHSFPFLWHEHQNGETTVERAAMMVSVTLPGIERPCVMQFDLGAPSSVLYRRPLEALGALESGAITTRDDENNSWARDLSFQAGTTSVTARSLLLLDHGATEIDDEPTVVGTLGADWIDGHVLTIDYAASTLKIDASDSSEVATLASARPFSFRGRRVFLPATLQGEDTEVWFDSGSSAFSLIVDEDRFHELAADGASPSSYVGNSWGKPVTVHGVAAEGSMAIGDTELPLGTVSWIEWPDGLQAFMMSLSDWGGMIGNQIFAGKRLVLDTDRSLFAVLP